ncbi:MAG: extensin family protein [Paracoccaceae bacterium]|nr:extensin family protein [Paracoccaceae bacterium]MDG2452308.1 extensin family protein [Paracoccaceae bacterium]
MPNGLNPKRRPAVRWAAFLVLLGGIGYIAYQALTLPQSPIPTAWNPVEPLRITDPVTPLTQWKLSNAVASPEACLTVLGSQDADVRGRFREDRVDSDKCFIRGRVDLTGIGAADIRKLETSCTIALRVAMWERHALQPAAQQLLGTSVAEIRQIGSYNCREIRTTNGATGRMSTHATTDAIDVTGFVMADGAKIDLLADWDGNDPKAQFLKSARDSACEWFRVTLGPDYNRLHADHFHLQNTGWGLCR